MESGEVSGSVNAVTAAERWKRAEFGRARACWLKWQVDLLRRDLAGADPSLRLLLQDLQTPPEISRMS